MMHLDPKACISLWPTEQCEWSTWDIWRSSDIVGHTIYFSLAFMLGYSFFVLVRFLLRYPATHNELRNFKPEPNEASFGRRSLISNLSYGLGTLKGISRSAPFFGLAGTSYGILAGLWFSYSGSPRRLLALTVTRIAFGFTPTLAGILVAIPAAICHNILRARIEYLSSTALPTRNPGTSAIGWYRFAESLTLRKRFSSLPPFALVAAPALACVICLFTPFHPYRIPTGLTVLLPSLPCRREASDRIIVMQVTASGELLINTERLSWTDLPRRLSRIYSTRARRELYLRAEDGASFQMVTDAIDAVRDPELNSLDINVFLVTPQAEADNEGCFAPIPEHIHRRSVKESK